MSVARVTEIISSSKKSFEDAIEKGIKSRGQDTQECRGRVGQRAEGHREKRENFRVPRRSQGHFYPGRLMLVSLGSEVSAHPGLAADLGLQRHRFPHERRHRALGPRQIGRLEFIHIAARCISDFHHFKPRSSAGCWGANPRPHEPACRT